MRRRETWFTSGGERCAAWRFRPDGGGSGTCVVMANGFSLTRHDGLPLFARRFAEAGAQVLAFDHRHLGDSGGTPRQRFRKSAQLEDWRNALAFAGGQDGVERLVPWGFSFSGAHVVRMAAERDDLAAAIVHAPFLDGLWRALQASPPDIARLLPHAVQDLAGRHTTIPVTAPPGELGAMTLPGEAEGFARSVPKDSPWRNEISPGIFATIGFHRPVARAAKVTCPLWVGLGERDVSVSSAAVERLASRAPRAELHRYDVDHFDPLLEPDAARIAADQVAFLRRCGLVPAGEAQAAGA